MSSPSSVQTQRIARLLGVAPDELEFLERLDADSLRVLREQITEVMFHPDGARLGPLQTVARMMPPPVTAKIAEHALGPILCGRLAGELDSGYAAAVAKRLPAEFLADVAGHVHPDRVESIVGRLDSRRVEAATAVLVTRDDLAALGHFAGIIPRDTLQGVVARLDAATILDVAPFVEPLERVDDLVGLIDDPVLLGVMRVADADRRWVDAFDVVGLLAVGTRTRIAELTVPESELIDSATRAAAEFDRWAALLSFAVFAGGVPARHWANIDALADADVIAVAVETAERDDLWDALATLMSFWPAELRSTVGTKVGDTARDRLGL